MQQEDDLELTVEEYAFIYGLQPSTPPSSTSPTLVDTPTTNNLVISTGNLSSTSTGNPTSTSAAGSYTSSIGTNAIVSVANNITNSQSKFLAVSASRKPTVSTTTSLIATISSGITCLSRCNVVGSVACNKSAVCDVVDSVVKKEKLETKNSTCVRSSLPSDGWLRKSKLPSSVPQQSISKNSGKLSLLDSKNDLKIPTIQTTNISSASKGRVGIDKEVLQASLAGIGKATCTTVSDTVKTSAESVRDSDCNTLSARKGNVEIDKQVLQGLLAGINKGKSTKLSAKVNTSAGSIKGPDCKVTLPSFSDTKRFEPAQIPVPSTTLTGQAVPDIVKPSTIQTSSLALPSYSARCIYSRQPELVKPPSDKTKNLLNSNTLTSGLKMTQSSSTSSLGKDNKPWKPSENIMRPSKSFSAIGSVTAQTGKSGQTFNLNSDTSTGSDRWFPAVSSSNAGRSQLQNTSGKSEVPILFILIGNVLTCVYLL